MHSYCRLSHINLMKRFGIYLSRWQCGFIHLIEASALHTLGTQDQRRAGNQPVSLLTISKLLPFHLPSFSIRLGVTTTSGPLVRKRIPRKTPASYSERANFGNAPRHCVTLRKETRELHHIEPHHVEYMSRCCVALAPCGVVLLHTCLVPEGGHLIQLPGALRESLTLFTSLTCQNIFILSRCA